MPASKTTPMVLHRNKTLASTQGYAICFVKGETVDVPNVMIREALEIGAVIVADDADTALAEVMREEKPEVISDPVVRDEKIRDAIELIIKTNQREDFTGTGVPSATAVNNMVTFTVQQKDVNRVWQKMKTEDDD